MNQILENEIPPPTKVYRTEGGYIVTSALPYKAMTRFQMTVFIALLVAMVAAFFVFSLLNDHLGRPQNNTILEILSGAILALGIAAAVSYFAFKNAPLRPQVGFDFHRSLVTFRFDPLMKWSEPIDENSAFMAEGNRMEYRRGLNQSVRGLRLDFTIDEADPDAHEPIIGFVTALNHVLKMRAMYKNLVSTGTDDETTETENPFA